MDKQLRNLYDKTITMMVSNLFIEEKKVLHRWTVFDNDAWDEIKQMLQELLNGKFEEEYEILMGLLLKMDCGWDLLEHARTYLGSSDDWIKAIITTQTYNDKPIDIDQFDGILLYSYYYKNDIRNYGYFLRQYDGNVLMYGYFLYDIVLNALQEPDVHKYTAQYIIRDIKYAANVYEFSNAMDVDCEILITTENIDKVIGKHCSKFNMLYYDGHTCYIYLPTVKEILEMRELDFYKL